MNDWRRILCLLALAVLTGCGGVYSWRPTVPADRRTVSVPTFRNKSNTPEMGAVTARQILREFQREGTFKISNADDAALEVQGEVLSVGAETIAFDRHGSRKASYEINAEIEVTIVDRRLQKVLIGNRRYKASVTASTGGDMLSAKRDAAGRVADELSRMVVDDVLNLKW